MMDDPTKWFMWVERLGGWGVVLLIVKWFMASTDRQVKALERAVSTFSEYQTEYRASHDRINSAHAAIQMSLQRLLEKAA